MSVIDLTGLDKADVLAALYNASRPQGMGFLSYDPKPMTKDEAVAFLETSDYFGYLKGRVMQVKLSGTILDPRSYDRDNGPGAAAKAIAALRGNDEEAIAKMHQQGTRQAATLAMNRIQQETYMETNDGVAVIRLGLADVREQLEPAIKRAKGAGK
jgi:hypothetical protein